MSTFYTLPDVGTTVTLSTHLQVREDAHILYAFADEGEREMFRALLKVNGVGAKMALAILSGMNAAEFRRCVMMDDAAALTRLPGIGKKTAERIVVELRDKFTHGEQFDAFAEDEGASGDRRLHDAALEAIRREGLA